MSNSKLPPKPQEFGKFPEIDESDPAIKAHNILCDVFDEWYAKALKMQESPHKPSPMPMSDIRAKAECASEVYAYYETPIRLRDRTSFADGFVEGWQQCLAQTKARSLSATDESTKNVKVGEIRKGKPRVFEVEEGAKTIIFSGLSYGKQYRQALAVVDFIMKNGGSNFIFKIEGVDRIQELEAEVERLKSTRVRLVVEDPGK